MINEKKQDLRIRRTHKLLWEALVHLMLIEKQSFRSITVNQICDHALVHRTTFYKHFQDKYDLLKIGFQQLEEELNQYPLLDRIRYPFQMMHKTTNHKIFMQILEAQKDDHIFHIYFEKRLKERLLLDLKQLSYVEGKFDIPLELVAEFYASVTSALGTWWAQSCHNVTGKEMDEYFQKMINLSFFKIDKE